jgi:micrococcal nuclease
MKFLLSVILLIGLYLGIGEKIPAAEIVQVDKEEKGVVVRVIDGDTIVVNLAGVEKTVRYIGVDTPEPYRDKEPACYSAEATERNKKLVSEKEVRLISDVGDVDRYDRLLRYVYVGDMFVNEILVKEGYATKLSISPNTKNASRFSQLEREAVAQKRGLWGVCPT